MNIGKTVSKIVDANGLFSSQAREMQGLFDWWNSNVLLYVLEGVAGTGKTFLINAFIKSVVDQSYTISAPTHKALSVLERQLKCKGRTLQALLGLRPDVNVEEFDVNNPAFRMIGVPKIELYKLIVIDESSMIPSGLFEMICQLSRTYSCKILFVGDPLQLPPVNEKVSKVFTDIPNRGKLLDIIRQGKTNPLLGVFEILRDDILNGSSNTLAYMARVRKNVINGEGFEVCDPLTFGKNMISEFKTDRFYKNVEHVRATAYTNVATSSWNNFIRQLMFDPKGKSLIVNDLLTGYSTIVEDETKDVILTNSMDYYIPEGIKPYQNQYGMKSNILILQSMDSGKNTKMLQIIDHNDPQTVQLYADHLSKLRANAISEGGGKKWYPFHKFKNSVLSMVDVQIGNRPLTRALDYGYALTTHKLQGSTFNMIFIDGQDICSPMNRYGKRYPNDAELRNRLLYVALSRARTKAFIKF